MEPKFRGERAVALHVVHGVHLMSSCRVLTCVCGVRVRACVVRPARCGARVFACARPSASVVWVGLALWGGFGLLFGALGWSRGGAERDFHEIELRRVSLSVLVPLGSRFGASGLPGGALGSNFWTHWGCFSGASCVEVS